jgi:hypothetical protein
MSQQFVVGGKYRNRQGEYEVISVEGEDLVIRYDDGTTVRTTKVLQERILENIIAEQSPPPPLSRRFQDEDSLDTQPILALVRRVLAQFRAPYPADITDQVCLTIENDPDLLREYDSLVEHFSSRGKDGKGTVNTTIGYYTKRETGMVILKQGNPCKSKLMKTYSTLGYRR